jgi:hypothetical protein
MADRPTLKITLTPEQQAQIQQATGQPVATLQLQLDPVEPRLAPGYILN